VTGVAELAPAVAVQSQRGEGRIVRRRRHVAEEPVGAFEQLGERAFGRRDDAQERVQMGLQERRSDAFAGDVAD